ncbi:MAG: hypothetical protein RL088_2009 [Verrucomicrobiota bacterium]|jgi:hypothetical protein
MRIPFLILSLLALLSIAHCDDTNIAFGKSVTASGALIAGYPAANVTDGDAQTFTHPTAASTGFYIQVDLGREYSLQSIVLYSRIDCCTDRLNRVRIGVYSDNAGSPGIERWGYDLRPDGSTNVQGASDVLTASLAAGTFRGRFIRITNNGGNVNNPQLGELEAFEAPSPDIRGVGASAGNITATGNPALPASTVISWKTIGATSMMIDQGIGAVPVNGSVTVTPTTTTTYTLTAFNNAGQTSRTITIGVDQPFSQPSISEFLSSNAISAKDEYGVRSDWVEIYNPNSYALNMAGYFLTDNPLTPNKWAFPAFTVPANGYAIVFADNSGVSQPLEPPHTNFTLTAGGEYLALIAPNGTTVINQFPADYPTTAMFPAQKSDVSYGITGATTGFFRPATPGAPNGAAFAGVVADTLFTVKRGFYDTPQTVGISCATPGAIIRYTTDTTEPTETTGNVYTSPLTFSTTTVLRAAAFRPGWIPSNVDTQTYVFTASVLTTTPWLNTTVATDPNMTAGLKQVPSLSLTTGGTAISPSTDVQATLEWLNSTAPLENFQTRCGVKNFGGAFTNFAKKSFRVSFKGEYGATKLKAPIFAGFERGLAAVDEFDQLEIRNGSHDMSQRGFYMSNPFTDATMLDMGAFAPHSRFVHMYINGVYWGLFQLRERWSADMMAAYYGGQDTEYESINGNLNVGGWASPGTVYDGDGTAWERIKSLALTSGSNTYQALRPYVDIPQYVDYMTMFMFGDSEDEFRTSGPAAMGHGFKFLLNDADGYLRTSAGNRTGRSTPGKQNGDGPGSIFSMLFASGDQDYRMLLADRIHKSYVATGGALTPARNTTRLTELCNAINLAIIPECARWNYRTPATWASSRDNILNTWFPTRTSTVLGFYKTAGFYPSIDAPVFNQQGGSVAANFNLTMSTPTAGATIYYTLDGSDPRVSGPPATPIAYVGPSHPRKYLVPTAASDGFNVSSIPGLVSYYPFDGDANDAISTNHGTLVNGATTVAPGRFGTQTLNLVSPNYVNLGNPASLQITGQFTCAAWIKSSASDGLRNIVNKGHSTTPNGEITLRINAGAYQGGSWNGSSHIAIGPAGQATGDIGTWVHLASVYDGTTWRLYRNGVQIASTLDATGAVPVTANWAIGARGGGGERYFSGQIDEVCIFNRGLSATEVNQVMNNTGLASGILWAATSYAPAAAWPSNAGGFGFDTEGTFTPHFSQSMQSAMRGVNASLLTRSEFALSAADVSAVKLLQLKVRCDDGYVAYLNGVRIASRNAPSALNGTAAATAATPDATAVNQEIVDVSNFIPALTTGTNVLAVHGMNSAASDDDFLLNAELGASNLPAGLSTTAIAYSAGAVIPASRVVKARAYLNGQWSALNEAFFQVGAAACPPGALAVSELHYNPSGDDDGEFLELMNVSSNAINLRGVQFTAGITFRFPDNRDVMLGPGQRIVLVDSQLTFQKIQGWSAQLGGIYSDNLSNTSEMIQIKSADGLTTLLEFTYGTSGAWPTAADGEGRSLVLINPTTGIDHSNPANWRPSTAINGNPNASDALTFIGNALADFDGDGLAARMEFGLGTSDVAPNAAPLSANPDLTFTVDQVVGADVFTVEATSDFSLWNLPVEVVSRQLLLNGKQRTIYRASGNPVAAFFRLRLLP